MKKNNDIVRSKIKVEVYICTVCLFTACALIITFIYQIVKLFNPVDLKTSKHPERGIRKQRGQSDVIILPGILGIIFLIKRKNTFNITDITERDICHIVFVSYSMCRTF